MRLTRMQHAARRAPCKTAFYIVGVFVLTLLAPFVILGPIDATGGTGSFDFETLTNGIFWQALLTLALLGIVGILGWWDITQISSRIDRTGLRPLFAVAIYPIAGIVTFTLLMINSPGDRDVAEVLLIVLALNLFVGLSEEILFRGILFGALRQKNRLIVAILVSSIAFGMIHLINAGAGQSLPETLFQMTNATALGVLFCGLVLHGNSLWPAVVLHMIWNAYAMMGVASAETMGSIPGLATEAPTLTAWNLILPGFISLIAFGVLYSYRQRSGARLFNVVPHTP